MATHHPGDKLPTEKTTNKTTQDYLKAALEQTIATGHSVRDFSAFALEKFGDSSLPHIRHFFHDIRHGQIKIKGMARVARARITGLHVTASQRQEMIRHAAYLRAEKRGFVGGSAEQDWCEAEKEVDAQLERDAGLIEKGHRVLTSANAIVEQEYDQIKHVVSDWIENRLGAHKGGKQGGGKASTKNASAAKPSPVKKAQKPAKKKATPKKKSAAKKAAPKKKSTAISTKKVKGGKPAKQKK